jgi:gluconolactonase
VSGAQLEAASPELAGLFLPGVPLEKLYTGCMWAEGPAYFPSGDYLVWSDIPANRMLQWVPELGVRVLLRDSNYSNGNTRDPQGRLVTCEHLSRSVVRREPDGQRVVLASAHRGKPLNSPNDVIVASDGAPWFTDPTYGILTDYEGKRAASEQGGCFVYRVDPATAAVEAVVDSLVKPNGLAFSLDESVLYVADSSRSHDPRGLHHVFAFDVDRSWRLSNRRVFAEVEHGVPDGLRLDELGNVWCSSARGVEVYTPAGQHLGCVRVPETVSNLTFGGPKRNRLFITATTSLYSLYVGVRGAELAPPASRKRSGAAER